MHTDQPDHNDRGFRRDNWFGDPEVETIASEHHAGGTTWRAPEMDDEKAESVTWQMLRGVAPKFCGVTIDDPAKEPTELTDPEVYPHNDGNREHLRRARINEEHGYITGGESTGVRLGDVSREEFLSIVEILLDHWTHIGHITEELADSLYSDAQSMKAQPDIDDTEAIERLVKNALGSKDFAATVDLMLSTWERAGHIDDTEATELMVEAVRLRNRSDMTDEDVIQTLSERALPVPVRQ